MTGPTSSQPPPSRPSAGRPLLQGSDISEARRAWVLLVLVVVYALNLIDRQIVGILAIPIKTDLALSDVQLSLVGGLAFALFYTLLGIPIGWIADRKNRVVLISISLTIWSAMTAVCGLATNFLQLFLARVGVGIGEAGGVAPSYSLISDYFPPERRGRALSIYSLGIPIGAALGILLGGLLLTWFDWRTAFILVGGLGILVVPVLLFTIREPRRGGFDGQSDASPAEPPSLKEVFQTISRKRSFWGLSFSAACSTMMGYGLIFWLPSFFVRSFDTELIAFFAFLPEFAKPEGAGVTLYASYLYGTILLVGGIAGIWLGGVLADRLGPRNKSAYAKIPGWAFLATVPFFLIGILSQNLALAFVIFLIPTALGFVWVGPVLTAFQHLAPANMRATTSAIFLFINNLLGLGLGNLIIGILSDQLASSYGSESLRIAISFGSIFYVIAGIGFLWSARHLEGEWVGKAQ